MVVTRKGLRDLLGTYEKSGLARISHQDINKNG